MLDSHPDLAIPPETGFLAIGQQFTSRGDRLREEFFRALISFPPDAPSWRDFRIAEDNLWRELVELDPFTISDGYRAFYRLYASRFGKPRWGDKTPTHSHHLETIESVLPEVRFVHVIRDGRDVYLSLRDLWFSPGTEVEAHARQWLDYVLTARGQGAHCRHYLEVRFEDLIMNTRETLTRVCDFLELACDERMLKYYERAPERLEEHEARFRSDGRELVSKEQRIRQQQKTMEPPDRSRICFWRSAMTANDRARFEAVAGTLLKELGYEVQDIARR
jgi:hypothetical protein